MLSLFTRSSHSFQRRCRPFSTNWVEQYRLLPEVLEAEKLGGEKSVALLARAAEICTNSMPSNHPLSIISSYQLACAHDLIGDYEKSNNILNKLVLDTDDAVIASPLSRALSITYLKMGQTTEAEEAAWKAYHIVDGDDPITTDVAALGEALQCVGLSRVVSGDFEGAQDYLQQSTRMCTEGVPSLTALLNLAGAHWWKGTTSHFTKHGLYIIPDPSNEDNNNTDSTTITTTSSTTTSISNVDIDVSELEDALSYFIEVIDIINGEEEIDNSGSCMTPTKGSTPAASTSTSTSTFDQNALKMDILKVNAMAGIGNIKQHHITLPKRKSIRNKKKDGDDDKEGFESVSLKNDMNEASEAMFTALTESSNILQKIEENKDSLIQSSSSSTCEHFITKAKIQLILIQMRALTILAKQKQIAGLAVSSEGLYRSALSEYDNLIFILNDNITKTSTSAPTSTLNSIGKFEKWQTLLEYQSLLNDWEDRESDAIETNKESNQILSDLAASRGLSKGGYLFSSLLQIPTLEDIGRDIQQSLNK